MEIELRAAELAAVIVAWRADYELGDPFRDVPGEVSVGWAVAREQCSPSSDVYPHNDSTEFQIGYLAAHVYAAMLDGDVEIPRPE